MALRFLCISPETNGDECPAAFLDEETGDLLVQGWVETDPRTLAQAAEHSPLAANEAVVRVPASMRDLMLEAMRASGAAVS